MIWGKKKYLSQFVESAADISHKAGIARQLMNDIILKDFG